MNILMLYNRPLRNGGIETLIIRLSSWLTTNGHKVTLVLNKEGELDALLNPNVDVLYLCPPRQMLSTPLRILLSNYRAGSTDIVYSFNPMQLWDTLCVSELFPDTTKVIHGVYHPRTYFITEDIGFRMHVIGGLFSQILPDSSKLFMNEAVKKSHEKHFSLEFPSSHIVPLPLTDSGFNKKQRKKYSIVSIGRLTAFKTYNMYMIPIVRHLLDAGVDVSWDIYGDGEYESRMQEEIDALNLSQHIHLHGLLPYDKFHDALQDAYVFIGMGTALIEAGLYGIPAIPAIDREGPVTYGYLHELPGFTVGECLSIAPNTRIVDLLLNLFNLDEQEYREECQKTRDHCMRYSIDVVGPQYLEVFENASSISHLKNVSEKTRWLYWLSTLTHNSIRLIENTAIFIAKKTLPRFFQELLRGWNRRIKHRNSLKQQNLLGENLPK